MGRRIAALVVIVFLAGLGGCSAFVDEAGLAATPTSQGPDRPREPTTTATPTPTGTTFDATTLQSRHVAGLRAAGSFTTSSSLVVRAPNATRYINGTYRIDRDGAALNAANVTDVIATETRDYPTVTRYTTGDTTDVRRVERTADGTDVTYESGTAPYDDEEPSPVNRTVAYSLGTIARGVIEASTWTETGTGTVQGATVTRYDADGDAFAAGPRFAPASGGATIAIDDAGVVRYVAYRFVTVQEGRRVWYRYEAGYTDVGNTTVPRPDWTDEA